MLKFIRLSYAFYGFLCFAGIFLCCYPFFVLTVRFKKIQSWSFRINKNWAWWFYTFIMMPNKIVWEFKPDKKQTYIFCPNHTSYLDIPILGLILPNYFRFVGKISLINVPLFGYMYKNLHIMVDKDSTRARYMTYVRCKETIDENISLVIFPEGTIEQDLLPFPLEFKDGAFRVAIEKQVPIVPVTIAYNWKVLPEVNFKKISWHRGLVIVHKPIETKGLTIKDLEMLKQQTFEIIDQTMRKYNPNVADVKIKKAA